MGNSRFLTVMVVGDAPEKLMEKYDKSLKVKPYIKYRYLDAEKMQTNALKMLQEVVNDPKKFMLNKFQTDYFKERLKSISSMSPFEYYSTITHGLFYDEEGNALSEVNPDGKWDKFSIGKNFSYPLKLKDGKEAYQAKAKDIDWDSMHMNREYIKLFETIWSLVIDDDEPLNKEEENLKVNWNTKRNYLSNFKTVDEFVSHNCAYWTYAFLNDKGWVDLDDENDETKWITNFFERFIQTLKDDDLITIYEYTILEEQ